MRTFAIGARILLERVEELARFAAAVIAERAVGERLEGGARLVLPPEPDEADAAVVAGLGREATAGERREIGVPSGERAGRVLRHEVRFVCGAIERVFTITGVHVSGG